MFSLTATKRLVCMKLNVHSMTTVTFAFYRGSGVNYVDNPDETRRNPVAESNARARHSAVFHQSQNDESVIARQEHQSNTPHREPNVRATTDDGGRNRLDIGSMHSSDLELENGYQTDASVPFKGSSANGRQQPEGAVIERVPHISSSLQSIRNPAGSIFLSGAKDKKSASLSGNSRRFILHGLDLRLR
jgi:hypothetical protein